MKKITLSLNLLQEKLAQMKKNDIALVELNFVPAQMEENTLFPAFLHLGGITKCGQYRDYESIDEFSEEDCESTHKSA